MEKSSHMNWRVLNPIWSYPSYSYLGWPTFWITSLYYKHTNPSYIKQILSLKLTYPLNIGFLKRIQKKSSFPTIHFQTANSLLVSERVTLPSQALGFCPKRSSSSELSTSMEFWYCFPATKWKVHTNSEVYYSSKWNPTRNHQKKQFIIVFQENQKVELRLN